MAENPSESRNGSTIHIDVELDADDLQLLVHALTVAFYKAQQEQDAVMLPKLQDLIKKIGTPILAIPLPGREKGESDEARQA